MFLGVRASRSYRACIMVFAASPPRRGSASVFQGTEKTISNANAGPAGCQIFGSSGISGEGRSRQEEGPAIAIHAAPGVNGHVMNIQYRMFNIQYSVLDIQYSLLGPQPNPQKNSFPLHPHTFSGGGGGNTASGAGLRGSVLSVDSVADLGWGGRATSSLQSLAANFPKEALFFPTQST